MVALFQCALREIELSRERFASNQLTADSLPPAAAPITYEVIDSGSGLEVVSFSDATTSDADVPAAGANTLHCPTVGFGRTAVITTTATVTQSTQAEASPAKASPSATPFPGGGDRLGGGNNDGDDPEDKKDHADDQRDGNAKEEDEEEKEEDETPLPGTTTAPPGGPSPGGEDVIPSVPPPHFDSGRGVGLPLDALSALMSEEIVEPDVVAPAAEVPKATLLLPPLDTSLRAPDFPFSMPAGISTSLEGA